MTSKFDQKLQVRQKGGKLPGKWTAIYMVLRPKSIEYFDKSSDIKTGSPRESFEITPEVKVVPIKNKEGNGFVFEIRAEGDIRIQHLVEKEEQRTKWATLIHQAQTEKPQKKSSEPDLPPEKLAAYHLKKKERSEYINALTDKQRARWEKKRNEEYEIARDQILDKAQIDKALILEVLMERELNIIRKKYSDQIDAFKQATEEKKKIPLPAQ